MTDGHVGHLAGTDLLQQDAIRGAVRQTYRSVRPTDRQVAERFYSPEELAGVPDETVRIALGVGNPVRHARLRAGDDVLDLASGKPFVGQPAGPKIVRFVSILAKRGQPLPSMPLSLPSRGQWCLKVLATKDRFVFGLYRREMRAIRYLGQLDKIFGVPATTRNWNTITAIAEILRSAES